MREENMVSMLHLEKPLQNSIFVFMSFDGVDHKYFVYFFNRKI